MHNFEEILNMTDEELIKSHNKMSNYTYSGDFFIKEYYRRQHSKSAETVEKMTRQMLTFTVIMTILTFVNVAMVGISLLR